MKAVVPLVETGARALGRQVLTSGMNFAGDVISGKDPKTAAKSRALEAGKKVMSTVRGPPGKRINRNRTKDKKTRRSRDIFD